MQRFTMSQRLTLSITLLVICIVPAAGDQTEQDNLRFAFVTHGGPGNPFWNVVIQGMDDAAQRYDVEAQWLSNPTFSIEDMADFLDDAIAARIDGLAITCPDPDAIRENVERARQAGIPVIVLNTADPHAGSDHALPTLFYIGASEHLSGQANGRAILEAAAQRGIDLQRALCPIQEIGHSGLEARFAGFQSVLAKAGVQVDGLTISNNVEASSGLLADYFLAHPDCRAIATLGPLPADALYLYMEDEALAVGDLLHVTHDTSGAIFDRIRTGYTLQAIDQQPYLQGYLSVMFLYLHKRFGLSLASDALTGPFVIDATNVDTIADLVAQGFR